jgi:hypothetical protein
MGPSLYNLGKNPTENTASNSPFTVLAIAGISFLRERLYLAVAQKQPFVYSPLLVVCFEVVA